MNVLDKIGPVVIGGVILVLGLALFGYDSEQYPKPVIKPIVNLNIQPYYAKDNRTGLCFAFKDWRSLAHVPCKALEKLKKTKN